METTTSPTNLDLQFRGSITGSLISSKSTGKPLCRYFGGIPYALPPVGPYRWQKPRQLPPCYRYGTNANPGAFTGKCGVCPQETRNELEDEDCLQLNVWIPEGEPPERGWPVYFYIHGGFLQVGNANEINFTALLSETDFKAIVVIPGYRLNVYGFLASRELAQDPANLSGTVGNLGFWDQRLALQWTYTNINYFGGDPSNITVAGYSAGAHSVFYQLAFDLDYPKEKRIIKRVVMHANGPGVQPKSLGEGQEQFDELCEVLKISRGLEGREKVRLLRETKPEQIRNAVKKMMRHQFRAVTDGNFVKETLFRDLRDGTFARKIKESNVEILIGESENEHFAYARWKPPANNPKALCDRLAVEYPDWAADALRAHYFPYDELPTGVSSWRKLFGKIYADVQIHATERGLIDSLCRYGAGHLVRMYRIDWRSSATWSPAQLGATHWSDNVIWFFGDGKVLPDQEKDVVREAFIDKYAKFVKGEEMEWAAKSPREIRRLRRDGKMDLWKDEWWNEKIEVWEVLQEASSRQSHLAPKRANL